MKLTEDHINFLSKLNELSTEDADSAWPIGIVLNNLSLPVNIKERISRDLLNLELIAVHPRTKDCVVLTDKGKQELSQ